MGGRGTFADGKTVQYQYKTVGYVEGIKVLEPINPKASKNCLKNRIQAKHIGKKQ